MPSRDLLPSMAFGKVPTKMQDLKHWCKHFSVYLSITQVYKIQSYQQSLFLYFMHFYTLRAISVFG